MNAIREFRRNTPAMTDEAEAAARARLMTAIHEPEAAPKRAVTHGLGRRIVVAAALALAVGGTAVVFGGRPDMAPVAGVAELGEHAARAAENDPTPVPDPAQWFYTKELRLTGVAGDQGDTWERWTRVDGKRSAWYQDGKLTFSGSTSFDPAELARPPVTPAGVLAKIEAAVLDEDRRGSQELNGQVPPGILWMEINQLISEQWLAPEVRAALFRALPTIKGITVTHDVPVADGRRGVAFSLTDAESRSYLVLDPETYRYLGTSSTRLKDRTYEWSDGTEETFEAGTASLTAQLEAAIVDRPGLRS